MKYLSSAMICILVFSVGIQIAIAKDAIEITAVEGQPLGANVGRVLDALEFLGAPVSNETESQLRAAIKNRDSKRLQEILDPVVLCIVNLNPESRVKVKRGPANAQLRQGGFTPFLVKIINEGAITRPLNISSPQSGPVYSGTSLFTMKRMAQPELKKNENEKMSKDRFLSVDLFQATPMTAKLSGLEVEYAIALIYSSESGKREATIQFDVGDGTQDLGFRGDLPILFTVKPVRPVKLKIIDHDGTPTAARLLFKDKTGRVYPPQAKRLAPDFFFQPHIYRNNGQKVLLPTGKVSMQYSRGPEYRILQKEISISADKENEIEIQLKRWVDPMNFGFYCGDHHIHAAGCAHYTSPTEGVTPKDMFTQVKGEGLNVGCILTWGPCWEYQREFFSPMADRISEKKTILKYDIEVSGFGSAAFGHVCLLNLKDQTYPGSEGSKLKGWPNWTIPAMRWCKKQGGVTGFAHSAMHVQPKLATSRLIKEFDSNKDKELSSKEIEFVFLPLGFKDIDEDKNQHVSIQELEQAYEVASNQLPNFAIPEIGGAGALEICVAAPEGVCDFISAMDTGRISEWNTWYHLLNCGFPIKSAGETDFPCMSGRSVGQGRTYVQLGNIDEVDFKKWCEGLANGQSYVSDGYAHALKFEVNGLPPGNQPVSISKPQNVQVTATVAFAPEVPKKVAYGMINPPEGKSEIGDTRILHVARNEETIKGGTRLVELVVNGKPVAKRTVAADGNPHDLQFDVAISKSSWVALRQFPQLHTNPVNVIVAKKPIRVSKQSARWCSEMVKAVWKNRKHKFKKTEIDEARKTYDRALKSYRTIGSEVE